MYACRHVCMHVCIQTTAILFSYKGKKLLIEIYKK